MLYKTLQEKVQQRKERPTHHKQQQKDKKVAIKKTQKQKKQNVWEVWSDETRVVVYSKCTTAEGAATEREREYTYLDT